jgi:TrmH family RNA methyltransferase
MPSRAMMRITSLHNPSVQAIRRAIQTGRPLENGLIVAEGPHLLEEALRSTWCVEQIWTTVEGRKRYQELIESARVDVQETSARVFESLSGTMHSQQVLALLRKREWRWEDLAGQGALIVILDGIQDPGNAGTIVRSAEAFGATGVVLLSGCVNVANGKFLRAAAGSIFRMPFLEQVEIGHLLNLFEHSRLKRYALTTRAGKDLLNADFRGQTALAVGSEGGGLSPMLLEAAEPLSICTRIESLNAAVACSIALFEAARQRRGGYESV